MQLLNIFTYAYTNKPKVIVSQFVLEYIQNLAQVDGQIQTQVCKKGK